MLATRINRKFSKDKATSINELKTYPSEWDSSRNLFNDALLQNTAASSFEKDHILSNSGYKISDKDSECSNYFEDELLDWDGIQIVTIINKNKKVAHIEKCNLGTPNSNQKVNLPQWRAEKDEGLFQPILGRNTTSKFFLNWRIDKNNLN